ncbi:hypothetical protein ATANTOWER_031264 [Ataeniobius toweri]|uniref:Uncharacterized protein n=1 Tax=Ataeniobius toweri TaxID=208326 RepID=A0ABU7A932_9TELE|nr:hypothetical protein [Ataeniobius toweri]
MGLIKINMHSPATKGSFQPPGGQHKKVEAISTDRISLDQRIFLETGYSQKNTWPEQAQDAAKQANEGKCIVCAQARPNLLLIETAFENFVNGTKSKTNESDMACLL